MVLGHQQAQCWYQVKHVSFPISLNSNVLVLAWWWKKIIQNDLQDVTQFCGTASFNRGPDSKVHGANMGPTWVLSAPDGPHIGPMNLVIRGQMEKMALHIYLQYHVPMTNLRFSGNGCKSIYLLIKFYIEDIFDFVKISVRFFEASAYFMCVASAYACNLKYTSSYSVIFLLCKI